MTTTENHALGHLASFLTILVWGTTFISTKVLLHSFAPVEILFIRFVIGYAALWLVCPRRLKLVNHRQEWYFAAAGLCGITLYYLFENIALTCSMASTVSVIVSVAPFFTALLNCLFLHGERPHPRFYIGFVIAMAGICLISFQGAEGISLNPLGTVLSFGAAVIWAAYSTLTKKISTLGYGTIQTTRRCFFYGLLFMIPALFFMDFHVELASFAIPVNLFNLIFLGLGASALCFVTWGFAVKCLGPVKTSVYIYIVPVVTTITSVFILHEVITPMSIGGIALTLVGLFLSEYRKEHQK